MDSKTETVSDKTDNELIAEFMGWRLESKRNYDCWILPNDSALSWYAIEKFATSWDWLVPVAHKFIEKTKNADMPHAIFMNVYTFSVCRPVGELYENIITGIKWYNSQSPDTIK